MNTVQYEPWSLMNRWYRDFDPMVGQFLGGSEPVLGNNAAWAPSVDVHEENDRFVVQADLPGVEAKDIEVGAEQGVLTIRGERRTEHRSKGLWSAKISSHTGGREEVFVMQAAKDRLGADRI